MTDKHKRVRSYEKNLSEYRKKYNDLMDEPLRVAHALDEELNVTELRKQIGDDIDAHLKSMKCLFSEIWDGEPDAKSVLSLLRSIDELEMYRNILPACAYDIWTTIRPLLVSFYAGMECPSESSS